MEADAQRCKAFVAAAEYGSYAEAAKVLGYSISSISRMIVDLERGCGFAVLDKGRFGVRITDQGRELLPHAKRIVAECERFSEIADMISGGQTGKVRIGSITSAATDSLPRIMDAYLSDRPYVSFELVPGGYPRIEDALRTGQVDFGTLRDPVPTDLRSELLYEDELVAVVPKGHPFETYGFVSAEDLSKSPFIALEIPESGSSEITAFLQSSDVRLKPAVSTWDDFAAMAMVEEGLGLTVLPETLTAHARFNVSVVPLNPSPKRSVYLAWRSDDDLSPAARGFLEYVREYR